MVFGDPAKACRGSGLREWPKMSSAPGNRETGVQMTAGLFGDESCGQVGRRRQSRGCAMCIPIQLFTFKMAGVGSAGIEKRSS